jgi:hypothetical protein
MKMKNINFIPYHWKKTMLLFWRTVPVVKHIPERKNLCSLYVSFVSSRMLRVNIIIVRFGRFWSSPNRPNPISILQTVMYTRYTVCKLKPNFASRFETILKQVRSRLYFGHQILSIKVVIYWNLHRQTSNAFLI